MPTQAPRVCARCGRVVPARTACPCRPPFEGAGKRRKGQGDTWRRRRDGYLRAYPICAVEGCRHLAVVVDHIVPLAEGGELWDMSNWQGLCPAHHQVKSTADALRGKRRPRSGTLDG
jgi:5-methylcytosine-specific restriction enzyme A